MKCLVAKISVCARRDLVRDAFSPRRSWRRTSALSRVSATKMAVFRVEWALLILVILKITFSTSEETCEKINTCSCKLSNGHTIDLKPVDGTATEPS
jgi:hypothetical protein